VPDGASLRGGQLTGALYGLGAAALFGVSVPLAKLLLPATSPIVLAGLLYLGAGIGVSVLKALLRDVRAGHESGLQRTDLPLLFGIVLAGAVAGPILLLLGLRQVSAVTAALLLNLEAPFTILIAVAFFRDHLGEVEAVATGLILLGALILSSAPGEFWASWVGSACVAGACLSWAIDNNLTQRLSIRDPLAIVRVKALAAAPITFGLALLAGERLPPIREVASGMVLGFFSYGLSIVFAVRALRLVGAAREAAYFATGPFIGALVAAALLREFLGGRELAAMAIMATGVVVLLRAEHGHAHTHDAIEHDHAHVHDEHHAHEHEGPTVESHAHLHSHAPLTHDHPHVPDVHHRHRH
jgi:drug/metabolite transporter (DMT)-like permease